MTPVDAATLLALCKSGWPAVVDLSGAQPLDAGQVWWPLLASIRRQQEREIDVASDHWLNLGAWAWYQAVTVHAAAMQDGGATSLRIDDVPLALFDRMVRANLQGGGWEAERAAYVGIGPLGSAPG